MIKDDPAITLGIMSSYPSDQRDAMKSIMLAVTEAYPDNLRLLSTHGQNRRLSHDWKSGLL
jgi:hypothetical protein